MKVLGIGLGRTGTMSLALALDALGYRTKHCPHFYVNDDDELTIDAREVSHFDALTDEPTILVYQEVDREHPGSKFILTVRAIESWLRSVVNNGESLREIREGDRSVAKLHEAIYGSATFDRDAYSEAYRRHVAAVKAYFVDRPGDLLVMNICTGDGWEKLCPFLGKPVPEEDFPRSNVFGESDLGTILEKRRKGIDVAPDPRIARIHARAPSRRRNVQHSIEGSGP